MILRVSIAFNTPCFVPSIVRGIYDKNTIETRRIGNISYKIRVILMCIQKSKQFSFPFNGWSQAFGTVLVRQIELNFDQAERPLISCPTS